MKHFISLLLAVAMCMTCVSITVSAQRDVSNEEVLAQELKDLGLFRGVSETDFDLDRAPSRVEALVMLIRVLGKESEVTGSTWKHPFTDVPGWANGYVGYAYSKGLTNGQSATQFGTGDANAAMYLTFVLRALGYSDTDGKDFSWKDPYTLARETGILSEEINITDFWRADVVIVSHKALSAYLYGSQQTLAHKLITAGVFTRSEFDSIYNKHTHPSKNVQSKELTAEDIYAKCSPAVFYIEIYDRYDNAVSSGSGFFIDGNGTAVTNYHVIEDAYSALIQVSDTQEVFDVVGVYDYNKEQDWAVIKIDCTGNKFLAVDSTSKVAGGQKVYAIGSPLGLQNTISEGIVSNPSRSDGVVNFIQTNAAISHGSSGGALIDKDGEVIGITSAGFDKGQNLNLALPMTYLDGYKTDRLVSLSEMHGGYNNGHNQLTGGPVTNTPGGSRKENAFNLLKEFVLENYQENDDSTGWLEFEETYENNDGSGSDTYGIYYDYEDDQLIISVLNLYYSSHYFYYLFNIDCDLSYSFSSYYFDLYNSRSGFEEVANGSAMVDVASFSRDYNYRFNEYIGNDRSDDETISAIMHNDGLNYVNHVFEEYLIDYGYYSVKDLGYISFEKFNSGGDTSSGNNTVSQPAEPKEINYTLSSREVMIVKGNTVNITLDYTGKGVPDKVKMMLESDDENVATASWSGANDSISPMNIVIKGESAGTTVVEVSNRYTDDVATIEVTVVEHDSDLLPNINYFISTDNLKLKPGSSDIIYLEYSCTNFPDDFNVLFTVDDEKIATMDWRKGGRNTSLALEVRGLSKGTTEFKIYNDYNDQYITGKIIVS